VGACDWLSFGEKTSYPFGYSISDYTLCDTGDGVDAELRESDVVILDDFVKPRFMGRHQRYRLVIAGRQLVFLRVNKRWFFRNRTEVSDDEIRKMEPLKIKSLSLGSYILLLDKIISIKIRESISFVLVLDPRDAVNFNLTGADDDIVHEVPMVLRRDKVKGVDVVERQWEITFEALRAVTSFLVPYDPKLKLPRVLLEKIK